MIRRILNIFRRGECQHDYWPTGFFHLDDPEDPEGHLNVMLEECSKCGSRLVRSP